MSAAVVEKTFYTVKTFWIEMCDSRLCLFPFRRAHLKECFETLKKNVPNVDEKKTSNLSVLRSALRYIQVRFSAFQTNCTPSCTGLVRTHLSPILNWVQAQCSWYNACFVLVNILWLWYGINQTMTYNNMFSPSLLFLRTSSGNVVV